MKGPAAPLSNSHADKTALSALCFPRFFTYLGYAVCSLVVAAVLLELGARFALAAYRRFHRDTVADIAPDNPAYSRYSWSKECMQEAQRLKTQNMYFPYRLWGVEEWHGSCTNNDADVMGAVRRTINPPNPACANQSKTKIWILGGSSVYGTLIPDWGTLPSYLSRELNTASRCVQVTNLGVEGYATNQELLLLMEQLKAGRVPDLVIFYDGFNDADIGTSRLGPATHMGFETIKGRLEGSFGSRLDFFRRLGIWQLAMGVGKALGWKGPPKASADELPSRAVATLNNYEENLRIARALGEAFDFKVCAFWQAALVYGRKPLVPYEQQLLNLSSGRTYPFAVLAPVYQEAERRAAKATSFVFLGHIFDNVPEPVYLDWVHLAPVGNQLAAHAVAHYIRDCLE